ncbi:MAG0110 family membrane protein [Mycoplasma sp. 1012]
MLINKSQKNINVSLDDTQKKLKNRMVFYSLLWLTFGLAVIFLLSYATIAIEAVKTAYLNLIFRLAVSNLYWLIHLVIILVCFALISYLARNSETKNIFLLVAAYIVTILLQSFWIPIIILQVVNTEQANAISYILLAMLIPTLSIAVFGFLGYFNIIDFSKLRIFVYIGVVMMLVLSIITWFISNNVIITVISVISIAVSWILIGFNFNIIQREASIIISTNFDEQEIKSIMLKRSLLFGLNLLLSFIRIFLDILFIVKK